MRPYQQMMTELASGWNTWNTFSIFSHVHLPAGFAINLLFKDGATEGLLREGSIGHYSLGVNSDLSLPGPRSYDGRYTEIDLSWRGNRFLVQSATSPEQDQVLLITPIEPDGRPSTIAVECGLLWNRPGSVQRVETHIEAETPHGDYRVYATVTAGDDA